MNFTLGTVQLGLDYGIANKSGKPDLKSAFKILDVAIKSGVKYYDTAAAYGNSEEILGEYFGSHKTEEIIITKLPPVYESLDENSNEIEVIDFVLNSISSSKQKLKSEKIDCLMFHRTDDYFLNDKLIINYLSEHIEELKIKSFGISLYNTENSDELAEDEKLSTYQIPGNLLDHRFLENGFIEKVINKNKSIFIRSLYLQGLFFLDEKDIPESLTEFIKYKKKIEEIILKNNFSIEQFTVNFFRTFYKDCNLIFGCETESQLTENLNLYNNYKRLDDSYLSDVLEISKDIPEYIINPALWRAKS